MTDPLRVLRAMPREAKLRRLARATDAEKNRRIDLENRPAEGALLRVPTRTGTAVFYLSPDDVLL